MEGNELTNLETVAHKRRSIAIAGVHVDVFTEETLTEHIISLTHRPGVDVGVGVNAHVCNLAREDAELAGFLDRSFTYADGQSVLWGARLLGYALPERLATTDLALPVLVAAAKRNIPVYFFGAADGVAETAARKLRTQVPGLKLRTHHGYVDEEEMPSLLADIAAHGTEILFVGLGDPRQQRWIERNIEHLPPVVLTCGGLFDWLSGRNKRAPKWMIRFGLEWLWRLAIEPRRLARRYIIGNPLFIFALVRQRLAQRN